MLYGSDSISAYSFRNAFVWMLLAFQAGVLNIGGLLACHSFVSHITGYATNIGLRGAQHNYSLALNMFIPVLSFLIGAMISGVLVDLRLKQKKKPKYYIVFGALFGLILLIEVAGVTGQFGAFGEPLSHTRDYILLSLLCLACGIQNGTITLISRSVVRTTHLTGIMTDLGVGLIRVINRRKLANQIKGEGQANYMRIGIFLFFTWGSLVGAMIFLKWQFWGFTLPVLISGFLFLATLYFQVFHKTVEARQ